MPDTTAVKDKVRETKDRAQAAVDFSQQAARLGQYAPGQEDDKNGSTQATEAKFITAQDPVIQTADGGRLPAVPIEEARKLNELRDEMQGRDPSQNKPTIGDMRESRDGTVHGVRPDKREEEEENEGKKAEAPLGSAKAPSKTNPLFPPLPMYGPPSVHRRLQCWIYRLSSSILSLCFLLFIINGAILTSIPRAAYYIWCFITFKDPTRHRPFHEEEQRRMKDRRAADIAWKKRQLPSATKMVDCEEGKGAEEFIPLEGGPDELKCDIRYYARRVGLDCEIFEVQTEDGFIIELWHLYNPRDYKRTDDSYRAAHSPDAFTGEEGSHGIPGSQHPPGEKKYPVLMIHGLLQSAGAYCVNDDDSLAFFLAKSGYDVWLGNNRCGFKPRHTMLKYSDPRMWAWNIRQMGVMDLPALVSRVLYETGFEKLGLIAHSQGTTQSLVALAKEQRPELGDKISVFCALAPAAYAGPLIQKGYFKFMQVLPPGIFRIVFGIHAFIPLMMFVHGLLPARPYGSMGYLVFSFLFNWSDDRWERDLRDRFFQFSPVYVSAESMRWWLGRECFAKHKCILSTRREKTLEEIQDETEDHPDGNNNTNNTIRPSSSYSSSSSSSSSSEPDDSQPIPPPPSAPHKTAPTSHGTAHARLPSPSGSVAPTTSSTAAGSSAASSAAANPTSTSSTPRS